MNLITIIEPEMATSKKTFFSDEHKELDIGVVKTIAATSDLKYDVYWQKQVVYYFLIYFAMIYVNSSGVAAGIWRK